MSPDPRFADEFARAEPEALGSVLSRLFALRGYGRTRGSAELVELWRTAAGEELARQTRPLTLRNGVLTIGVASSPLLSELASFHHDRLLEALQSGPHGGAIRGLKFRRLAK